VRALVRKKKKEGGVGQGWLMTFSDMVTLLLVFFVLLNIMSTIDADKFKQLVANLNGSPDIFHVMNRAANMGQSGLAMAPDIPPSEFAEPSDEWLIAAYEMQGLVAQFNQGRTAGMEGQDDDGGAGRDLIVIEVTEGYIVIRCQGEVLFDTLSDRLRPDGMEALGFIVDRLIMPPWNQGLVSEVRIEGYADERPVQRGTSRFEDNLVLSTFRAVAAYRYIVNNYDIPARSVSPSGYGDTRPLAWLAGENGEITESREEWLQRNRRVEFVLMRNFFVDEETGVGYRERS
jgi:chemotaxis protein MotB